MIYQAISSLLFIILSLGALGQDSRGLLTDNDLRRDLQNRIEKTSREIQKDYTEAESFLWDFLSELDICTADSLECEKDYSLKESGESIKKPWASWWYPISEKTLFEGRNSSLSKYDRLTGSSSSSFERDELYYSGASAWEGHCDAWAIASLLHPEPTSELSVSGESLSVADQKALLIKMYDDADLSNYPKYGSAFGVGEAVETPEDIKPYDFLLFSIGELLIKKKPFIMDYDKGRAVWNVPVFSINLKAWKTSNSRYEIKVTLGHSSPRVERNFVGTGKTDRIYRIRLDQNGSIIESGWVKESIEKFGFDAIDSIVDHPDYLIPFPGELEPASRNIEIDDRTVLKLLGI